MVELGYKKSEASKRLNKGLDFLGCRDDASKFSDFIKPYGYHNCGNKLLAELQRYKLMEFDLGLSKQSKPLLPIGPDMFDVLSNLPATA